MEGRGIVINRMFVGDYLSSNLGHEIINLFLADNGGLYLYLNSNGSFAKEHDGKIDYMLMVKSGPRDCFEVIGIAKGLHAVKGVDRPRKKDLTTFDEEIFKLQKDYIKSEPEGDVKYGGVSILELFNKAEQQSVFITYRADTVLSPKDDYRIFLLYDKKAIFQKDGKNIYIPIRNHNLPKTSLKSYIYSSDNGDDYENIITGIIEKKEYWSKDTIKKVNVGDLWKEKEVSLFDICQIQNDENRLSNALAYFMNSQAYISLWIEFFSKYGIVLSDSFKVEREVSASIAEEKYKDKSKSGGRIDLLIKDDKNFVVIENKIKSDINRVDKDPLDIDQLCRYKKYGDWIGDQKDLKPAYFLLAPNYQKNHLQDKVRDYKIITYGDLYAHLTKPEYASYIENDRNFKAYRDVIVRHTQLSANAYLYDEMMEKFKGRIKRLIQ